MSTASAGCPGPLGLRVAPPSQGGGSHPRAPEKPRVWEAGWRPPPRRPYGPASQKRRGTSPQPCTRCHCLAKLLGRILCRAVTLPPLNLPPPPPSSSRPRAPCIATSISPGPRGPRSEVLPSSKTKVLGTDTRLLPKPCFLSPLGRKLRSGSSSLLFYDMPRFPKLSSKGQENWGNVPSDRCAPRGLAILLRGYLSVKFLCCARGLGCAPFSQVTEI